MGPRNCLYFICPQGGWRDNIRLLLKYGEQFDGQRAVCVVHGPGLEPLAAVVEALGDWRVDRWVVGSNDPLFRETAHWLKLLACASDWSGVTWFGHTKGGPTSQTAMWRDALYETTLALPDRVATLLTAKPIVGPFRRDWKKWLVSKHSRAYTGTLSTSEWHFSGTFFWFRNTDLFARNWNQVEMHRWGVEAYPSNLFSREESACIAVDSCGDLYNRFYWRWVSRELSHWRASE